MYVVYSMEGCAKCKDAIKLLTAKGLEHIVFKIDEDIVAARFVQKEGHRSMPQIYLDDVLVPGGFAGLQKHLTT